MRHLPDITLVFFGGNYGATSLAAIQDIRARFTFEQEIVFADAALPGIDTIVTPMRSVEAATRVSWRDVYPRLTTGHALMAHWDGYPVNPEAWDDGFRAFDFIGAVWPWFIERSVGNTGFSLQSRRFLRALADLPLKQPEDIVLCREYRPELERSHGIRFADEATADRFSVEHGASSAGAFGFHGIWNILDYMPDSDVQARLNMMEPRQWGRARMYVVSYRALVAGRRDLYRWIEMRRAEINA